MLLLLRWPLFWELHAYQLIHPYSNPTGRVLLWPLHRGGNGTTEEESNLPCVPQLTGGGAGGQARALAP